MLIERKILCYCESDNIGIFGYTLQYARKLLHRHPSAAAAIPNQLLVCEIGRVKQACIQHINIKMY